MQLRRILVLAATLLATLSLPTSSGAAPLPSIYMGEQRSSEDASTIGTFCAPWPGGAYGYLFTSPYGTYCHAYQNWYDFGGGFGATIGTMRRRTGTYNLSARVFFPNSNWVYVAR